MSQALAEFEGSISTTRARAYELGMVLLRAETAMTLSPVVSRRVFAAITASQAGLDAALASAADAHRTAQTIARSKGIAPTGYGPQCAPQEEKENPERRFFTGATDGSAITKG